MGLRATPLSMAALATAMDTSVMRRGSTGFGMKYSGPKMLFSHPIFAMSHVTAMIKYKKQLKKQAKRQSDKNAGAEKVRSAQTNDQKKDTE